METAAITEWMFIEEVPIPADVGELLIQGEQPYAAFKTFRDSAIFTSKRLIVRDAQGMTGKKVEIYSLPYSVINMWSTENAGKLLDLTSEVELWTRAGHIKIKLGKKIDVRRIDSLIALNPELNHVINHQMLCWFGETIFVANIRLKVRDDFLGVLCGPRFSG